MWFWSRLIYFNWTFSLNLFIWSNLLKCNLNMIIRKFKLKIEKELEKKIDLNKDFISNNIDSLDLISIVIILENELKIKIS